MNLIPIVCEFCLVVLGSQIFKINTVSAYVFPEIKFRFPSSEFNWNEIFSSLYVNIPNINPLKSLYLGDFKHVILKIDELASKLYNTVNIFIRNSEDLFSHFKVNNFAWNWTRWHTDFDCSELNISDFKFKIENELFGQHIVRWSLPELLNNHLGRKKSMKPLLISFQGPTGCGKSFVSKMMAQSLLEERFNQKFVHTYYGSRDFFHEKEKDNYRKRLLHEIPFFLSLCDNSLFIFEEMDKMVPGVIDVILPFIYSYKNTTNMYAANSIFLFISNSGAKRIEEIAYDAWFKGVRREDMTLAMFSVFLKDAAYNEPGGLQHSEIIKRNLIDMFLPFLPLEKEHVKQCVLNELNLRKIPVKKNVVEYIVDQVIYNPPEFELFAESGCKRISQKIDLYGETDL